MPARRYSGWLPRPARRKRSPTADHSCAAGGASTTRRVARVSSSSRRAAYRSRAYCSESNDARRSTSTADSHGGASNARTRNGAWCVRAARECVRLEHDQWGPRGIVSLERARGARGVPRCSGGRPSRDRFDLRDRDAPGSQHHQVAAGDVYDRGLDAHLARPAVEHEIDVTAEVRLDVRGSRGAHSTEAVRGGRRDGAPERAQERQGDGVPRNAHAHGVLSARDGQRHAGRAAQDQGERSWPEVFREPASFVRHVPHPITQPRGIAEMHDQGVRGRAALHGVEPCDRAFARCVSAKAVDRFGREGHEPALAQDPGGTRDER